MASRDVKGGVIHPFTIKTIINASFFSLRIAVVSSNSIATETTEVQCVAGNATSDLGLYFFVWRRRYPQIGATIQNFGHYGVMASPHPRAGISCFTASRSTGQGGATVRRTLWSFGCQDPDRRIGWVSSDDDEAARYEAAEAVANRREARSEILSRIVTSLMTGSLLKSIAS